MKLAQRTAFTLLELLVVISIITLLMATLLPSLSSARETAYRSRCANNLGQIGKSVASYQAENSTLPLEPPPTVAKFGKWVNPVLPQSTPATNDPISFSYTPSASGLYPEAGAPLANFWLLVLTHRATPALFICPSDPKRPVPADTQAGPPTVVVLRNYLDFGESRGIPTETNSYAFAYPWTGALAPPVSWWRTTSESSMPLAADVGPSSSPPLDDPTAAAGTAVSNSKNHGGLGQNVVFADSHAEFCHRNDVGYGGDNIYTANKGQIVVLPAGTPASSIQQFSSVSSLNVGQDVIMVPARP